MDKTIETGVNWEVLDTAREECRRAFDDLMHQRQTDNAQEARVFGVLAGAFYHAQEAIFEAINAADAYGNDPQVKELIAKIGGSLPAAQPQTAGQTETQETSS